MGRGTYKIVAMSAPRTDEAATAPVSPSLARSDHKPAGPLLDAQFRKRFAVPTREFVLQAEVRATPGFTILFGPSGAGKTTVLDCVAGLTTPDSGRIAIGDRVLFDAAQGTDLPVAKRRIGYVFQSLALFPHLTVEQNVRYGLVAPLAGRSRRACNCHSSGVSNCSSRPALPTGDFWRRKPAYSVSPNTCDRSRRAAFGRTPGRARRINEIQHHRRSARRGIRFTVFPSFMSRTAAKRFLPWASA